MKRPIIIISAFLTLTISLSIAEVLFAKRGSSLLGNNILVLTLFNINLILIVVLFLLLSRSVVKFIFDKHQTMFGNRFRTKLILAFVGFSIIPSILLFIVASGLLTNSINNWFNIQVEKSLINSLDVARSYYDEEKKDILSASMFLSDYIAQGGLIQTSQKPVLSKLIEEKKVEHNLSGVEVFNSKGELLSRSVNNNLIKRGFLKMTD